MTDDPERREPLTASFDAVVSDYDRWYDAPEGRVIFRAELAGLRRAGGRLSGRWLEVGVGTGRFASELGISAGADPSSRMLEIAAERGLKTVRALAEELPFQKSSFDGVLLALTLCFVADPARALEEGRRVLRPNGRLLLGIVPADGPWGREYQRKAARGHPVYSLAHFRTAAEIVEVTEKAGFTLRGAASTLFWPPGEPPPAEPRIEAGIIAESGFVGMSFGIRAD